ncbi:MAG: UTP--glucose-1-phosphate uridylyltransferase GalU [Gammaproteobacteria bacterium]
MTQTIKTAIFPVAGLGTRFLPITKSEPKEMLPIIDKPLIQYVVEEAIAAGIEHLVFVTSSNKRAIEDYFDRHYEYESRLEKQGKTKELALVKDIIPEHVSITYIRQANPNGLGDAILVAQRIIGDNPFAVLLADDIIDCPPEGCLKGMIDIFNQTGANVIAVQSVDPTETDQYGIVSLGDTQRYLINNVVEKPNPSKAPSNLGIVGRYVLTPGIFKQLQNIAVGVGNELQLTDAIAGLLQKEAVIAYPFKGRRYDCGSKAGFIEATIDFALKRDDLKQHVLDSLKKLSL